MRVGCGLDVLASHDALSQALACICQCRFPCSEYGHVAGLAIRCRLDRDVHDVNVFENLVFELHRTVNGREVKHEDPVLALLCRV